jgi:hypothetical protein
MSHVHIVTRKPKYFRIDFLGEYEAIILKRLQAVNQGPRTLFDEKNRGSKILWQCPFKVCIRTTVYRQRLLELFWHVLYNSIISNRYLKNIVFKWTFLLQNIGFPAAPCSIGLNIWLETRFVKINFVNEAFSLNQGFRSLGREKKGGERPFDLMMEKVQQLETETGNFGNYCTCIMYILHTAVKTIGRELNCGGWNVCWAV